ncbi:tetratricopeptide repeat protein 1-like [Antedon mediterranea]|uniref:tetratricopeptide repeat protein 1-like n=1 Tax=Antedon mediterranea TaxID=105859 RepID=UPI003AF817A3
MEKINDCTSSENEDDEQYFDATENVQLEKKQVLKHVKLDDIFGKGEPVEKIAEEEVKKTKEKSGKVDGATTEENDNSTVDNPVEVEETENIKLGQSEEKKNDGSTIKEEFNNGNDVLKDCAEKGDGEGHDEVNDPETLIKTELAARMEMEDNLSDEEKMERKEQAQQDKMKGNTLFKNSEYLEACDVYTTALELCPLNFKKERSIMYSNRAACKLRLEQLEDAISDCTEALILNPLYMRALLRRAQSYELNEKLDEALADYQKALEMDPGCHDARSACMRLPDKIKERNEKLKEEMMGKLKDLGNMVLRPFGLSTSNFQFNQDPNSGSYSMNFVQSPTGGDNGK